VKRSRPHEIDPSTLTWDFATARSDYTDKRAAMAAKFPNGAFGLESSIDLNGFGLPTTDPEDAGPRDTGVTSFDTGAADTATGDSTAADSTADAPEDGTADAPADADETAIDAVADTSPETSPDGGFDAGDPTVTDVEIAFGTKTVRRVTRLRGDLPVATLSIDLKLEADDTQAVLPIDINVTKYVNETSVCPSGVQPSSTGSMLGLASVQCNTSGGEGDPLRVPLFTVLGFVGVAVGRRAIRRSRRG